MRLTAVAWAMGSAGRFSGKRISSQWPGGFHVAYAELAEAFAGGRPDPAVMEGIAERHDFTLHGPPLAALEAVG